MTGRIIGVVGPSGVGKDTIMAEVQAANPDVHIARRVITRSADAGGEAFRSVSVQEFEGMAAAGAFALWWSAHGLFYGIPQSVPELAEGGQDVLVNLSRSVLQEAAQKFTKFEVLSLTASRQVLASRLAKRGRETEVGILARLERKTCVLPNGIPTFEVVNERPLHVVAKQISTHYFPKRGSLCSA